MNYLRPHLMRHSRDQVRLLGVRRSLTLDRVPSSQPDLTMGASLRHSTGLPTSRSASNDLSGQTTTPTSTHMVITRDALTTTTHSLAPSAGFRSLVASPIEGSAIEQTCCSITQFPAGLRQQTRVNVRIASGRARRHRCNRGSQIRSQGRRPCTAEPRTASRGSYLKQTLTAHTLQAAANFHLASTAV